ncbi:MAG: hypothetical protein U9R48_01845 [Chloroflexota bacterium]|nr:hypothetical protein [Chloroflexota bacterium]
MRYRTLGKTGLKVLEVGVSGVRFGMRQPRFVEINTAILDDVNARLDLEAPHCRFAD